MCNLFMDVSADGLAPLSTSPSTSDDQGRVPNVYGTAVI